MSQVARRQHARTVGVVVALGVIAALLTAPAVASAARVGPQKTGPATTATVRTPAKGISSGWKWTKAFSLATSAGLKKHLAYGAYGLACPSSHLCVIPMDGTNFNKPNTPAGDFYTTDPARGSKGWKFKKWTEDYAPGDTLSVNNIACEPAGNATDCIIAGREPVAGSATESYGAAVFQTGVPTVANWGTDLVDDTSAGFGAVSCWVNVQCAEVDDNGVVFTTAGASTTATASVFSDDAGFSGIWSLSCAPYSKGQPNPFCALVDGNGAGTVAWSVNPGDPAMKWHRANLGRKHNLAEVACFGPGACLINDNGKLVRTHGNTGSKTWVKGFKTVTLPKLGKHPGVTVMDCNENLCAVGGQTSKLGQYVALSTNPAHGNWHVILLSKSHKNVIKDGFAFVSCPTSKLCVVGDAYGHTAVGTR